LITSPRNPRLRLVNRLRSRSQRERLGLFVCAGEDIVAAALEGGLAPSELFIAAEEGEPIAPAPLEAFSDALAVESGLLASVTGMAHPPRVVGVFRTADLPRAAQAEPRPHNVSLWRVSDPGNVGTIVRSADALGPCSVYLSRGCGDPTGPKAVRAAAGALVRVPLGAFDEAPRPWFALVPGAGEPISAALGPGTFVCGAEREGLPPDIVERCDRVVSIPIAAGSESLNVSIAAAVALDAVRR
jgi:TrmH family RNA methyltransferase